MQLIEPVKRRWAFAVPFFTAKVADAAALNQRLIAELNASRATHVFTHLHESRYENTYVELDHVPSAKPIFDIAESMVSRIMGKPVIIPKQAEPGSSVLWFWFNETKNRGGVTSLHNHWAPWSLFSGCYYIKVPPKSGNLVFSRWRSQTVANEVVLRDADFFADIDVPPSEGLLILFPSWLEHLVRPNESDEPRISLAFNFRLADGSNANFRTSAVIDY
jgi:hypothetical protein